MDDPLVIYKDLDLRNKFRLDEGWSERLQESLLADCSFVESCQVCNRWLQNSI